MKLRIILSLLLILVTGCAEIDTKQTPSYQEPKAQVQQEVKIKKDVIAPIVEKTVETKSESKAESVSKTVETVVPKVIPKPIEETIKKTEPIDAPAKNTETNCHPSYSGCLKIDAGDYDCVGGSGNGPNYTGKVKVIGSDVFGLDRDKDGWGCE